MTAPVLFLDVDGVLNHRAVFLPSHGGSPLCEKAIRRLRSVVERTGCKVVLSSTWRMLDAHVDKLSSYGGFPSAHDDWRTIDIATIRKGQTPGMSVLIPGVNIARRGEEIAEWLSRHPEVERYAIVDDDADMLPEQMPYFVQTTFDTGLTDDHADRLIALLAPPSPEDAK